jgi:hypothetical protein
MRWGQAEGRVGGAPLDFSVPVRCCGGPGRRRMRPPFVFEATPDRRTGTYVSARTRWLQSPGLRS